LTSAIMASAWVAWLAVAFAGPHLRPTVPKHSAANIRAEAPGAEARAPGQAAAFQLNQGKAIDALRRDYPRLLTHEPDFTIFSPDIELFDPTGKRLSGASHYANVFAVLRFLRSTAMNGAEITYRLVAGDNIRVRWTAKLWMRGLPAESPIVYLDGCSVYELDAKGKVRTHRLEDIVMLGDHQQRVSLGFAWPHPSVATPEVAMPFFRSLDTALLAGPSATLPPAEVSRAVQADAARNVGRRRTPPPRASASASETPMERAAREREEMAAEAKRVAALRAPREEEKTPFFSFGGGPQPCESTLDCERPMVCCDLYFASICCSGGLMVGSPQPQLQEQLIPIPVERDGDGPFPGAPQAPPPGGPRW